MRGNISLSKVKTRADYELLNDEDKIVFKKYIKGTISREVDIQSYPANYFDNQKKEGDEGFIAPIFKETEDMTVANRFGFTKQELE